MFSHHRLPWLAAIIGWVGRLTSVREAQLERANLILNPPDRESIMALDKDKQGVDELEFVVGMLMSASPPRPSPAFLATPFRTP